MADPATLIAAGSAGSLFAGAKAYDALTPDLPEPIEEPEEVIEEDVSATRDYKKKRLKQRKGRASTVLGSSNTGLKTVLG